MFIIGIPPWPVAAVSGRSEEKYNRWPSGVTSGSKDMRADGSLKGAGSGCDHFPSTSRDTMISVGLCGVALRPT